MLSLLLSWSCVMGILNNRANLRGKIVFHWPDILAFIFIQKKIQRQLYQNPIQCHPLSHVSVHSLLTVVFSVEFFSTPNPCCRTFKMTFYFRPSFFKIFVSTHCEGCFILSRKKMHFFPHWCLNQTPTVTLRSGKA